MGEYTLTDPYIYPGTAPHQASLKPELSLKQAYPGFNSGPEPLQPLKPWLLLVAPPLFSHLPSFRDTDPLDSAILQPVLISLRIETPVASTALSLLRNSRRCPLYHGFEQSRIGWVIFEYIVGGDDAVVGLSQKYLAPKLGIRPRLAPLYRAGINVKQAYQPPGKALVPLP